MPKLWRHCAIDAHPTTRNDEWNQKEKPQNIGLYGVDYDSSNNNSNDKQ